MNEIIEYQKYNINTHDFENSKNEIKKFSEKTKANPELSSVSTSGGLFGWFDHKVTGDELNEVTSQVQKYLIDINSLHIDMIAQFGEIYKTFEALDDDYIKGILISIGSVKKTNDELKVAQKDIKNTIEIQKKTIKALSGFKEQLEKYKHLSDIDAIWSNISKVQSELTNVGAEVNNTKALMKDNSEDIKTLVQFKTRTDKIAHLKDLDKLWDDYRAIHLELSTLQKGVNDICKKAEKQVKTITVLCDFKNRIDALKHLDDIDEMWHNNEEIRIIAENTSDEVKTLHSSIEENSKNIDSLAEFKSTLEQIEHLNDIDELWNQCADNQSDVARIDEAVKYQKEKFETLTADINSDISNHQQQLNDLSVIVTENRGNQKTELDALKTALSEMQTVTFEKENLYTKKLRVAYIISGCGFGMAVVELVLLILKVL